MPAGETSHLMVIMMLMATWQRLLPSHQLLTTLIHKHVGEVNLSVMKPNHNKPSVLRRCSPGNRPATRALVRDPRGCRRLPAKLPCITQGKPELLHH